MAHLVKSMNLWVLSKINAFLTIREGFTVERSVYNETYVRSTVRDALGYRYEVEIRTLGRIRHTEETNAGVDSNI